MKRICLFILLMFTFSNVYSASDCGVNEDGSVKVSNEICKEDVAYGLFKKVLGDEYLYEPDNIEKDEEKEVLEYSRRSELIFKDVLIDTSMMAGLVIFAISVIMFLYSTLIDLTAGEVKEKNVTMSTIGVALVFIFVLAFATLKENQFSYIQKGASNIVAYSIGSVNKIGRMLLASAEGQFYVKELDNKDSASVQELHSQAVIYAKGLIEAELCRKTTSNKIFTNGLTLINKDNEERVKNCVYGDGKYSVNFLNIQNTGEITEDISIKKINLSNTYTGMVSTGFSYNKMVNENSACAVFDNYKCVDFKFERVNFAKHDLLKLANETNYYDVLDSELKNAGLYNLSSSDIGSGFKQIVDKAKELNDGIVDFELSKKLQMLASAYFIDYHNAVMSGYVSYNNSMNLMAKSQNLSGLNELTGMASDIADLTLHIQCMNDMDKLQKAEKTKNFLNSISGGEALFEGGYSTQCLNYRNGSFGIYGKYFALSEEGNEEKYNQYIEDKLKEIEVKKNNLIETIANAKVAIKKAYLEKLRDINVESNLAKYSKQGVFSNMMFAFDVLKKTDVLSKVRHVFDTDTLSIERNFAPNYLSVDTIDGTAEHYSQNKIVDAVMASDFKQIKDTATGVTYVNAVISDYDRTTNNVFETTQKEIETGVVYNLKEANKEILSGVGFTKLDENCDNDSAECINFIKNPVISFDEFGNSLINISAKTLGASIVGERISSNAIYDSKKDSVKSLETVRKVRQGFRFINDMLVYILSFGVVVVYLPKVYIAIISSSILILCAMYVYQNISLLMPQISACVRSNDTAEEYMKLTKLLLGIFVYPILVFTIAMIMFSLASVLLLLINIAMASVAGNLFSAGVNSIGDYISVISWMAFFFIATMTILYIVLGKIVDTSNTIMQIVKLPSMGISDNQRNLASKVKSVAVNAKGI